MGDSFLAVSSNPTSGATNDAAPAEPCETVGAALIRKPSRSTCLAGATPFAEGAGAAGFEPTARIMLTKSVTALFYMPVIDIKQRKQR